MSTIPLFPWLSAYPPGARTTIDARAYTSVIDLMERTTAAHADSIAITAASETLTFAELQVHSRAWTAWLIEAGIHPGDRVAVMLPNLPAFPIALLGTLGAGAVQVSINPMYTARELRHQLQDSAARVLVVAYGALPVVRAALDGTAIERLVVVAGESAAREAGLQATTFTSALAQGAALPRFHAPPLTHDHLALLQYTGGTTGVSKGAELTHGNLVANVLQMRAMLSGAVSQGHETIVTALPLYHIFALTVNFLTFASFGARNVLVTNPRDPAQLVAAFTGDKITVVTGVNTLFAGLLAQPQLKDVDFHQIKLAIGGGSAIQGAVSDAWHARSGRHILEGYGLSETAPVVTINSWANAEFTGTIGFPVPSTDVVIADEQGEPLPAGSEGEICVKGPQVMRGYWNLPEATAAAFTREGYFRTGDIGFMDARGCVRICDRKKDMVLVSGFNVYPNEVEEIIARLPGVAECAVTGIPDSRSGEVVKAFVVRQVGEALTEGAVLAHCRENLAPYKVPKVVEFIAELPKSTVGKILRRDLRVVPRSQVA
ncbi:AMP-binding protein [Cupriavidus necator]|uniref:AMP-binding protein n=1 Tax=Cupriavidus necator TaxID=106590 RepID=UPI003ECDD549